MQKLKLLQMSLDNRLNEMHTIEETTEATNPPPVMPKPAALTGALYIKLIGVEGLLELQHLRLPPGSPSFDHPLSPNHDIRPRAATIGFIGAAKSFMTLPTSHRHQGNENASPQNHSGHTSHTIGSRKNSRQGRSSSTLTKQESMDDSIFCMCINYCAINIVMYFVCCLTCQLVGPGEVCAVLCLDNKRVANTDWKPPSNASWEQLFKLDLDKVYRYFCC